MNDSEKLRETTFRKGLIGICKVHFALVALIIVQIILYDASKLIPPEVVLDRWVVASMLLAITGAIWYFAKSENGNLTFYKSFLITLIGSDIALASYFVYDTRGMASRAVLLYVLPIIIAGLLLSRSALFATAILCIAAYSLTAVGYFVLNFNEGYKVELYGEVGFYSALFLIVAGLLAAILHPRK
ncbi:hypothetical protein KY385_02805 [Candidatus Parcubacteria bacterium]|nr:hypothetical protein [Candidatus Parcubacteria bacterium]